MAVLQLVMEVHQPQDLSPQAAVVAVLLRKRPPSGLILLPQRLVLRVVFLPLPLALLEHTRQQFQSGVCHIIASYMYHIYTIYALLVKKKWA